MKKVILITVISVFVIMAALIVINSSKNSKCVVYKINPSVKGIEYMAFSRGKLTPEFVNQKILDGDYILNTEQFTSLKKEIGIDSGYVWHICFKLDESNKEQNQYTYGIDINRISSTDIKRGTILSIPVTTKIPLKWPGWWGDAFYAKMQLPSEMH